MSRRDLKKVLDRLAARAKMRHAGKIPLIDTTVLFTEAHWDAFESGDLETRERMRNEYEQQSRTLIDSYNVGKSESSEIVAIVVAVNLTSEPVVRDYALGADEN